eukprot:9469464-Pyramimonas_sp.AAC.1
MPGHADCETREKTCPGQTSGFHCSTARKVSMPRFPDKGPSQACLRSHLTGARRGAPRVRTAARGAGPLRERAAKA